MKLVCYFSPLSIFALLFSILGLATQAHSSSTSEQPAIVLIMVDGARPDLLEKMALSGELPNIQKYFFQQGTFLENTFTPLSLTVPSWSTILSGVDIDRNSIKGNDVFDRQTKNITNYLDWRNDILFSKNLRHGRAYRALRSNGHRLIIDWFNRGQTLDEEGMIEDNYGPESEIFMTFFPVNDRFPLEVAASLADNLLNIDLWGKLGFEKAFLKLLFDFSAAQAFDRNLVDRALEVIADQKGPKKKVIGIYLTAVDHLTHLEHQQGIRAIKGIDEQVGRIFKALRQTRYQDSVVAMISDHGSLGGHEPEGDNHHNPLRGETYSLTNTNLSHFLAGWYNRPGLADYSFNVEAAFAAEGHYSLRNFYELQMQPFQCTNVARIRFQDSATCESYVSDLPQQITAGVTSSQTISLPFAAFDSSDWTTANNWHTLTHYVVGRNADGAPIERNIIRDLENFTLDNLLSFNSRRAAKIGNKPLDWLAIRVAKDDFNRSPAARNLRLTAEEEIILIHKSSQNQALILKQIRKNAESREVQYFRYIPIENFAQEASGVVSFDLSSRSDPFGYRENPYANRLATGSFLADEEWFQSFHTDKEWAARYARTIYPNVISALPKLMSFRLENEKNASKLRADIHLNPRYGHFFTVNNDTNEANHGMWQRESVNNLFMMAGPGIRKGYRVKAPVFSTDILPTIFRAAEIAAGASSGVLPAPRPGLDGEAITEIFE